MNTTDAQTVPFAGKTLLRPRSVRKGKRDARRDQAKQINQGE